MYCVYESNTEQNKKEKEGVWEREREIEYYKKQAAPRIMEHEKEIDFLFRTE